ncbi:MAG: cysteine desulfurase [SAR202 cluster bacterium]|nr:cysteine desulfurase [Chloroflexota bacterium]MDP6421336.1 cysteine desulfurase [SAR202 cluster bacterium]MDP6665567.1 cysteine desulfurase [SAR202 cluster bacterium]MDP6799208.1 cysteine desulfurase [SAR202 cluster bacterium]MQG57741.1 cysteine desulfurase [SAR202 cluster bacterium]
MYDVKKIREDFPILSRELYGKPLVYLDNAATSQKPRQVIDALTDYYTNYNANVHRGVHTLSQEATDLYEGARTKVARFINADEPEEIVWTRNTTESINLVAHTWAKANIQAGDEIVVTPMEHHSNLVPWQQVARESGAKLRIMPLAEDAGLDMSQIDQYITSRTKLLAMVHVSNGIGAVNPVKELAAKARKVGAAVLVDGAQSVPHMPVDVKDIDCDFMAFSGHKMLGPTGIGALYVKRETLEEMDPFLTGGEMVLEVWYDRASWNDLPMRFEAGTPNIADAVGLGAAVDYLEGIGMENIRQHEVQLTEYALDAFKEIEAVDLFGPLESERRGGILSFHTDIVHPHDLGTFLDRDAIAIRTGHHCTMPLMRSLGVVASARASLYLYNTEEEIDCLVDSLKRALRYFGDGTR